MVNDNWMLLLIDTDEDGIYNNIIRPAEGRFPFAVQGNSLEIAVPRKLLGKEGKHVSLLFKWTDNPSDPNDIISISTTGDTAPNRRFAYRFVWER